jgi:hypothetical protein
MTYGDALDGSRLQTNAEDNIRGCRARHPAQTVTLPSFQGGESYRGGKSLLDLELHP